MNLCASHPLRAVQCAPSMDPIDPLASFALARAPLDECTGGSKSSNAGSSSFAGTIPDSLTHHDVRSRMSDPPCADPQSLLSHYPHFQVSAVRETSRGCRVPRPRGVSGRVKAPQLDSVIIVFACELVRAFIADLSQLFGTVCYLAAARFHAS